MLQPRQANAPHAARFGCVAAPLFMGHVATPKQSRVRYTRQRQLQGSIRGLRLVPWTAQSRAVVRGGCSSAGSRGSARRPGECSIASMASSVLASGPCSAHTGCSPRMLGGAPAKNSTWNLHAPLARLT